jgi:hypothetical protein
VVVADVEVEDEYQCERRWYGSDPEPLPLLGEWLIQQQVEEVMISGNRDFSRAPRNKKGHRNRRPR